MKRESLSTSNPRVKEKIKDAVERSRKVPEHKGMISTSDMNRRRGRKNPDFLSTDMILPEIKERLDQIERENRPIREEDEDCE